MHAEEMRWGQVPDARVAFHGCPGHSSLSTSERTNLPDPVAPEVRYRDARVRYVLASQLTAREGEEECADPPTA
ncbi:hypothetical protein [Streptomyces profundus]|uniref:hypothetical protein n=1 Tax=Streptomyces profundus TaxID=2867410 RepID=UPI001D164E4E|nr:hypothetical protein [Streptomyces sp. MA3_2.13]UED86164.1 hypothetical protein K4G22_19850 [Streptomyces sp. MA3_2.13]